MPEPCHLIENPELSCPVTDPGALDNRLIHGDNLPALKALEREFRGRVKCIYIDPPYNTGNAFEQYDDKVRPDQWLAMMKGRLELLHGLLDESGTLCVHLDDNELGHFMVLADGILGRANRVAIVTFKQSSVSGPKVVNAGLVSISSYVVVYSKNRSQWKPMKVYIATERDRQYRSFVENYDQTVDAWHLIPLQEAFTRCGGRVDLDSFVLAHAERVVRKARISPKDITVGARAVLAQSSKQRGQVFQATRPGKSDMFFLDGEKLIFYSTKVREIDGLQVTAQAVSTIWDDLLSNGLANEGGVTLRKGKKPEALLKRLLEIATNPGDLVLDAFAGSGTTGAVSHKMGRRWIMIEKGDHCRTHIVPRMKAVIAGTDQGGVSKAVGWKGGGGFRYLEVTAGEGRRVVPSVPAPAAMQSVVDTGIDLDQFLESHPGFFDEAEPAKRRGRRRA